MKGDKDRSLLNEGKEDLGGMKDGISGEIDLWRVERDLVIHRQNKGISWVLMWRLQLDSV